MNLTIHRGTHEIGGSCVELKANNTRIILDIGFPLKINEGSDFDSRKYKDYAIEDLVKSGILPDVKGLYKNADKTVDAVLISHPHQDHFGFLQYIHQDIPVYLSKGCEKLIKINSIFNDVDTWHLKFNEVESWKEFSIGDIQITPYLMDHSGFDALAFLIEGEDKKIFYTGDFRAHGRKGKTLFENIIKQPPRNIDYLIMEGTLVGSSRNTVQTETEIEEELVKTIKNQHHLFVVSCSSQNIDRLVSIFRACVRTDKIFVIDPYTAFILEKLKDVSASLPQFDWGKNIRVFYVPNKHTEKLFENKVGYRYKSAKITIDQIGKLSENIVIKDSYHMRRILASKKFLGNAELIYSQWEGYLSKESKFWEQNNILIKKIHTSGHAFVEDLQTFVDTIKPQFLIPIHTENPAEFTNLFNAKILNMQDAQTVQI